MNFNSLTNNKDNKNFTPDKLPNKTKKETPELKHARPLFPVLTPQATQKLIIDRLNVLIAAANKASPEKGDPSTQAAAVLEVALPILNEALTLDIDITQRLGEIANNNLQQPSQQCRQLKEMQLYLTLLNSHSNNKLNALINKLGKTIDAFTEATSPKWEPHLTKLEALIREGVSIGRKTPVAPDAFLESIAANSVLDKYKAVPSDPKVFAFVNLESMILHSKKWEGSQTSNVVEYLDRFFNANAEKYSSMPGFQTLKKMIGDEHQLFKDGFERGGESNFEQSKAALSKFLGNRVLNMQPGDKTLIPIGWTGIPAGHSMQMEIGVEPSGSLRVAVYNLGDGVEHHPMLSENGEALFLPYVALTGVEITSLLNNIFIQALVEIGTFVNQKNEGENGSKPTNYGSKDIYGLIFSLGGKEELCNERSKFMMAQYSGTCTFTSLCAVLHSHLSPKDYFSVMHDLSFDTICGFYQSVKENLGQNEESRQMLKQAVVRLAQTAVEDYEAWNPKNDADISQRNLKLQKTYGVLKMLDQVLKNAEDQVGHGKISEKEAVFENIEELNDKFGSPPFLPFEVEAFASYKNTEMTFGWEKQAAKEAAIMQQAFAESSSTSSSVQGKPITSSKSTEMTWGWVNDAALMQQGLRGLRESIIEKINSSNHLEAALVLDKFFQFQTTPEATAVWSKIPPKELSGITVALADLGEVLLPLLDKYPRKRVQYELYANYLGIRGSLLASENPEHSLKDFALGNSQRYNYSVKYKDKMIGWKLDVNESQDDNMFSPEDRLLKEKTCGLIETYERSLEKLDMGFKHSDVPMFDENEYQFERPSEWKDKMEQCPLLEMRYLLNLKQKGYPFPQAALLKYTNDPGFYNDSYTQMVLALCDMYGEVLPPAFCALHRQALIASAISSGYITKDLKDKLFSAKVGRASYERISYSCLINGCNFYNLRMLDLKSSLEFTSSETFNKFHKEYHDQVKDETHYLTESDILGRQRFYRDEWIRQLVLIITQGDFNGSERYLEQQITKAVAYISRNLPALENHDKRMLIRHILFKRMYIEKIVEKSPAIHRILCDFIQRGFAYFSEKGDVKAAVYFLEMARNMEALPPFKARGLVFADIRTVCTQLLKQRQWERQDRTLIYQQIAASYAHTPVENLNVEGVAQLLTAGIHNEVFPLLETYAETGYLQDEVEKAFANKKDGICQLLQGPSGSQICNLVMRNFYPEATEQTWNCTDNYPLCISEDGLMGFDVDKKTLYGGKEMVTSLPRTILKNPEFCRIFSKSDYLVKQTEPNSYDFTDEKGLETKVKIGRGDKVTIYQKVEGNWRQLIMLENATLPYPSGLLQIWRKSSFWAPLDKKLPLVVLVRNQAGDITHRLPLKKENPPGRGLIWGSPTKELPKKEPPLSLMKIQQGMTDKNKTPLYLLFQHGMIWKNQKGDYKFAEYPALGLTFNMNQESTQKNTKIWRAECIEYPGYYIAPNQQYRGFDPIEGGIILENTKGKRKLILPYGKISPAPGGTGSFTTQLLIEPNENIPPSLAIDLDANSQPIAKSREQKIYLATLLLMQKQYEPAQALLRASFSYTLPYNKRELELFSWLCRLPIQAEDFSPHAGAIISTALALLPTDVELFTSEKDREQFTQIGESYIRYRSQQACVPHLKLKPEEDRRVLDYLHLKGKTFSQNLPYFKALSNDMIIVGAELSRDVPTSIQSKSTIAWDLNKALKASEEPPKSLLITRPGKRFNQQFLKYYKLALNHPKILDIKISAAEQDPDVRADLVMLLRSAAYAKQENLSNYPGFPPSIEDMSITIMNYNNAQFNAFLQTAREVENVRLSKSEKILGLPAMGETKKIRAQAQTIETRTKTAGVLQLTPLAPRTTLLTDKSIFEDVPSLGIQLSPKDVGELQQAITGPDLTKATPIAKQRAQQIADYWGKAEHAKPWHRLKPDKVSSTKTALMVEKAEMGKQLNRLETELLMFANALPESESQVLLFAMEKSAKMRQPVTLRDLTLFTARAGMFTLAGKNPSLSNKEQELLQKCVIYLDAKAQQQQLERALRGLTELEAINQSDDAAYKRQSEKVFQELTRMVPYNPHENPELLAFEVLEDKGLYLWQVSDLKRVLKPAPGENPNVILEKVMGAGKTKIYLPLIALSQADGDHIAFIIVHSSQYDTVAEAMETQSGQHFAQVAHTLNFSRSSSTSLDALSKIYEEIVTVQKQRHFFVATDKSMHSLGLAFDELWDEYLTTGDSQLEPRIEMMRNILNLIKTKGKATLDEADLLLNCRYEVVYAQGEAKPIKESHRNLVADLYKSLASHLKALEPFTEAAYLEKKPELIDTFVKDVVAKQMPEVDLIKVKAYLNGAKAAEEKPEAKKAFQEGAEYIDSLSKEHRNLLSIAFHEFEELLPIVLEKRCGEHYGYSENPGKVMAVPYLASGVASPTAEYSFPYAMLGYTMQTLMHKGISHDLLKHSIQLLHSRALNEIKEDPTLGLPKTEAFKEFTELCGGEGIPFWQANDKDIERLVKMYQDKPPNLYEFAKKYILPAASQHPRKFTSTSFSLFNMFLITNGFTGTPWNEATFPKGITTVRDPNSAGKTEGIIWKNSQAVYPLNETDSAKTVKELNAITEHRAKIDVGALFNGVDNQAVAKAFLDEQPTSVEGALFFQGNRACILKRGNDIPVPFDQEGDTKNLYIFYDQWHTTGTDFVIPGNSLLSIGKNTKMRDLEQGYMRDRQAAEGKRVSLVLPPETAQFIRKTLKLSKEAPITTTEVLRCVELNQEHELNEQLLMAALGGMREVLKSHLKNLLQNSTILPSTLRRKAKEIQALIGDEAVDEPYELLGRFRENRKTELVFKQIVDEAVSRVAPLISELGVKEDTLRQELINCIDFKLLPKTMPAASTQRPDQCAEQQSQQQSQQERMAMQQKDQETEKKPIDMDFGLLHWNFLHPESINSRAFYRILKPADMDEKELPVGERETEFDTRLILEKRPLCTHNETQTPFFAVSEVFAMDKELQKYADVFDIETSYNVMPVKSSEYFPANYDAKRSISMHPFDPLGKNNPTPKFLLICRDSQSGAEQVRLLSQADEGFFFNHLHPDEKREVDVTLYSLDLKVLQSNVPSILEGKENPVKGGVLDKIVQAKFLNGESHYAKAECDYLRKWIKEKGVSRMEELFVNQILPRREGKMEKYKNSPLHNIFTELDRNLGAETHLLFAAKKQDGSSKKS